MSLGEVENFNALTDVGVVAADQAPFADDLSKVQARKDIVERMTIVSVKSDKVMVAVQTRKRDYQTEVGFSATPGGAAEAWFAPSALCSGGRCVNEESEITHVFTGWVGQGLRFVPRNATTPQATQYTYEIQTAREAEGELQLGLQMYRGEHRVGLSCFKLASVVLRALVPRPAPDQQSPPEEEGLPGLESEPTGAAEGEYVDLHAYPKVMKALHVCGFLADGSIVATKEAARAATAALGLPQPRPGKVQGAGGLKYTRGLLTTLDVELSEQSSPALSAAVQAKAWGALDGPLKAVAAALGELYGIPARQAKKDKEGKGDPAPDKANRGRLGRRNQQVPAARAQRRQKRARSSDGSSSETEYESSSDESGYASDEAARVQSKKHGKKGGSGRTKPPEPKKFARLDYATPKGGDLLEAAGVVLSSKCIAEALGVDKPKPTAGLTQCERIMESTRCDLALHELDEEVGHDWQPMRPANLEQLAEWTAQAEAILRKKLRGSSAPPGYGGTAARPAPERSRSWDRGRSRDHGRSRSRSRSRSKGRGEMKAAQRRKAVRPRTAQALHDGESDLERMERRVEMENVRTALAGIDDSLRGEVVRAFVSTKVDASGERRSSRSKLPPAVLRMTHTLSEELATALRRYVREVSNNKRTLDQGRADSLAAATRTLDVSISDFVSAVRDVFPADVRGPQGGRQELLMAWQLAAKGIQTLGGALSLPVDATGSIETELGPAASISKLAADRLREYVEGVLREWSEAGDAFRKGGDRPSLAAAVAAMGGWLVEEKGLAACRAVAAEQKPQRPPRDPKGPPKKPQHERQPGDKGPPAVEQRALWKDRPTIPEVKFKALRQEHMQKYSKYCWASLVTGCRAGAQCKHEHATAFPAGWADMCYKITGVRPSCS